MSGAISPLQKARSIYQPKLPAALKPGSFQVKLGEVILPPVDQDRIKTLFPNTFGQPLLTFEAGESNLSSHAIRVGVVLSGGQAPGGHNVIAGLFDALKASNGDNKLFGFLKGPIGIVKGNFMELTAETIDAYRNTGGFDMIMSGRDKIESAEDLKSCLDNMAKMDLNGLVVVGGDDSNTNAAMLAEYLKSEKSKCSVVGVPKTIDGDMRNEQIEMSFGFDTACKTYSEVIGNICRDATSAIKYWHFVRLMGRAASHVTLECGLATHANITLISEEIRSKGMTLAEVADGITDVVIARAAKGRNYGIVLIPEGLLEFIPELKSMIDELATLLGDKDTLETVRSFDSHEERTQFLSSKFSALSAKAYASLPEDTQAVLLNIDSHGNPPLSQVETEKLLIDLVKQRIASAKKQGKTAAKFTALSHFVGYEGRCAAPSNFDADYCYSLGYIATQVVRAGYTGYTVSVKNLNLTSDAWLAMATPVTSMLNIERRLGKDVPVIKKALVELDGKPFKVYAKNREMWAIEDDYVFPGPIQYFGPTEVCDTAPITLQLERG